MSKEKEFFSLAKKMNERFSIIPLLFGSVALSIQVGETVYNEDSDIDFAVPHYMRPDRKWICPDLIKFMENEGYEFVDMNEGQFHKGEFQIQIGRDNFDEEYAHVDIAKCPIMQTDGAIYKILTLEDIFKSYSISAVCDFRHPDPNADGYVNTDQIKAEIARKALERN